MKRAGTIIRSPLDARNKDKDRSANGDLSAPEVCESPRFDRRSHLCVQVLALVLEQIAPLIYHEDEFLTDFLQINDARIILVFTVSLCQTPIELHDHRQW